MRKHFLIACLSLAFHAKSQEQKIDSCTMQKKTTDCCMDVDRQYIKIREKADFYFYAGNYEKALNLYERMLLFRANDWYPKMQAQRMKVYVEKGF